MKTNQKECVHSRHCKYRGCKYGEEDICPVYLGQKEPDNDKSKKPSAEEFRRRNIEEDERWEE